MAIQEFNTQPARIAKLKGEILKKAIPMEVLGITGQQKQMPKNASDTVIMRRYLPFGGVDNRYITGSNVNTYATSQITTEGVTPSADTLTAVDVVATLQQYHVLYAVTDKTVDLYEDDIPTEMKSQTGERVGLIREMVRYGELKGCTNVYYGGAGSDKGTTNGTLSLNLIRKITRNLRANHAKMITKVLAPSPNISTVPVEAGYLVFCHTDLEPAIRDLPGFKHVVEYGTRKPIHEMEIGSVEGFRFILSPELAADINTGAAVGSTGLFSTGASNIDLYPVIVAAEDAWAQVALRGQNAMDVTYIAPGQKDKNDPLGQRGFIGASFYHTVKITNNGFMALAWVGTPAL
jgi:N4-gp56 family major capsid protein